jgi:hypothetical protein
MAAPSFRELHLPPLLLGQKIASRPELRAQAAAKMRDRPQTALLTAKGPKHARAIAFCLRSPDGVIYKGRNVLNFVRTHENFFDPVDVVWKPQKQRSGRTRRAHPQCRASKGLASLFGQSHHVRFSWKGWTRAYAP